MHLPPSRAQIWPINNLFDFDSYLACPAISTLAPTIETSPPALFLYPDLSTETFPSHPNYSPPASFLYPNQSIETFSSRPISIPRSVNRNLPLLPHFYTPICP